MIYNIMHYYGEKQVEKEKMKTFPYNCIAYIYSESTHQNKKIYKEGTAFLNTLCTVLTCAHNLL